MNTSSYKYDQLNRLKSMEAWSGYNSNSWNSVSGPNNTLNTAYSYTANGNITGLSRKDHTGNLFDDLSYTYTPGTNRLIKVNDSAPFDGSHDDIEDQTATTNYTYDASGNMIGDAAEGLTIAWNYLGKVDKVTKANNTEIIFRYDGMGHRVVKIDRPAQGSHETQTIYFRDASGNVMAVYEYIVQKPDAVFDPNAFMEYRLEELHIYGSSRIGLLLRDKLLDSSGMLYRSMPATLGEYNHWIAGNKRYELTNHLGNVLSVVSDRKIGHSQFNTLYFSYYTPDIRTATDYYPFGWAMPGRQVVGEYRYGFQGQEMDDEIKGDGNSVNYKYRMHDPRLGRFFAIDPLSPEYPFYSPYAFSGNRVIDAIELEGLEPLLIQKMQKLFDSFLTSTGAEEVLKKTGSNSYEVTKKAQAVARDGLIIIGGVVTTIASGSVGTGPYLAAFGVTSGLFATAAGSAKLGFDLQGNHNRSSEIPTSPLGAFGRARDELVGDENLTGQAVGDIATGIILLFGNDFTKWSEVEVVDRLLTVEGVVDGIYKAAGKKPNTDQTKKTSQQVFDHLEKMSITSSEEENSSN